VDERFDLFGNPVRAGTGRRGRPAFQVTERNANKVRLLLALGWANQRVANAIGCSLATLKRHFRADLEFRDAMRDRLDAERIMATADQALKGNVGAQRLLDQMIEKNDRMEIERQLSQAPKSERLGKKEIAVSRAMDADAELELELAQEVMNVRH
jgi:ATP/maltotriose-dependent transcriptional regulator MalT